MAARRLTCVLVPGQAGVLAVITTGSTVCGVGTFTFGLVRDFRASVYAAACPPSSTAISVNRVAAAVHLSLVACLANPGYIVVCSQVSPLMESFRLSALVPTNPASTASAAKCSCSSTWAVPLNSEATAVWWVPADAAEAVGMRSSEATPSVAIPSVASVFLHLIMMTSRAAVNRRPLVACDLCPQTEMSTSLAYKSPLGYKVPLAGRLLSTAAKCLSQRRTGSRSPAHAAEEDRLSAEPHGGTAMAGGSAERRSSSAA